MGRRRGIRPGARGWEHVAMFYSRRAFRPKLLDGGVQRGAAKGHLEHEEIQRGKLGNCKVTSSHSHTLTWVIFTIQLEPPVPLCGFQNDLQLCPLALGRVFDTPGRPNGQGCMGCRNSATKFTSDHAPN
ncbi:hypothetical protein PAXRUDRAFT_620743 [Paxillus rubicundulus Ve08.2h10]|uniref:Uncharacterized protein n=1 Tax=Paxillus rubicundulus Ve08.2h10 TaxID=930991 RepID=A0A0D0DKD1_9AGAM|nr:hypothetical protein PAXRUDRAFT_620743 [Paxillus rubicundulus Ve08.2h10]